MDSHLTYLIFGWLATLTGTLLGGLLVFKTKRDPSEASLFTPPPDGEAFNLTDEFSGGIGGDETRARDLPQPIKEANDRFVDIFAENLAKEAGRQTSKPVPEKEAP